MPRLVVNEELKFGRVKYVSLNKDWARIIDLHTGDETFIHVYEKGNLHAMPHRSSLPFVEVLSPYARTHDLSVPEIGSLIRFKAGEDTEYRPRAVVWVTADEWLECLSLIAITRSRESELLQALSEQETNIPKMFVPDLEPFRLFG
jgi:hypothetical protein